MLQRTLYNQPLVFPLPSLSAVYSTTLPISPPLPPLPSDGQAAAAAASHPPTPRARASLAHLRYQNIPTVSCHSPVRGVWKSSCVLAACLPACLPVCLSRSVLSPLVARLRIVSHHVRHVTSHTPPASCIPHPAPRIVLPVLLLAPPGRCVCMYEYLICTVSISISKDQESQSTWFRSSVLGSRSSVSSFDSDILLVLFSFASPTYNVHRPPAAAYCGWLDSSWFRFYPYRVSRTAYAYPYRLLLIAVLLQASNC